jgi:N-acetylglutamate synthase-like GNAT family acetyltransferase
VTVRFRASTRQDLAFVEKRLPLPPGDVLPHRAQLVTALIGDEIVGVGGVMFAGSVVYATMLIADELRAHRFALHRAVLAGLERCRKRGIRRIVAFAEPGRDRAEAWLRRLGFEPGDVDGHAAWIWSA